MIEERNEPKGMYYIELIVYLLHKYLEQKNQTEIFFSMIGLPKIVPQIIFDTTHYLVTSLVFIFPNQDITSKYFRRNKMQSL